jgi:hypothetical protein
MKWGPVTLNVAYAAIHFEARVDRFTFLSNRHLTAEQFRR